MPRYKDVKIGDHMKITNEKFEEKIYVNALYKGSSTELRITYCTKYDEPQRLCMNQKELLEFRPIFDAACAEFERRAEMKASEDEE